MKLSNPLTFILSVFLLKHACFSKGVNDTALWKNPTSKLKWVFSNQNDASKTEVLKLYSDNSFEYLTYQYNKNPIEPNCIMDRVMGNYELDKHKLVLSITDKKIKSKNFKSEYYFKEKSGLYNSHLTSIFSVKKQLLALDNRKDFSLPFYIDPKSQTVVNNPDASYKIDLKELVTFLIKGKNTEREKMMTIIDFIHRSIEYDYHGLKTKQYANDQFSPEQIIAGKQRLAVCAGYSHVFSKLCSYAGITCKYITGYAKNSKYYADKNGSLHAWNIVTIGGKEELYDVTWADGNDNQWLNVKPELFVYTHFPRNEREQLLKESFKTDDSKNLPYVLPYTTNYMFTDFYPKTGSVFVDSTFQFIIDGTTSQVSINKIDGEYFNMNYSEDSKKLPVSYSVKSIDNYKKNYHNGKTIIDIPLSNFVTGLTIQVNGCSYTYKVVKGNLTSLFKTYITNANKNNLDSYIKGVLSCIVLSEDKELAKLAGAHNSLFFEKNGKIKNSLQQKFKNWDGNLSEIEKSDVTEIKSKYDHITKNSVIQKNNYIENSVNWGINNIVFEKSGNDYSITKIK